MPTSGETDNVAKSSDIGTYYEEVQERCCGSGRWQLLLVIYISLMWWLHPLFSMSLMFIGATPEHRCADGFDENATFASLPADTPQCHPLGDANASCTRWVFDTSMFLSTVVTEWSLVCGRKPLLSMLQSLLMIGGVVGSVPGGQLADRFGRRTVFLPAMLTASGCAFAAVLVPDYASYAAVWCLAGVSLGLMVTGTYVLVTELGAMEHRAALISVFTLPFSFGTMLVAALSYAIRTRWLLQLAYAAPWLLFWPSIWLMPESPRWLVVQGRFEEAYRVFKQCARWNGRQLPPKEEVLRLMEDVRDGMLAREAALKSSGGHSALRRSLQLITLPRMRRNTLCFILIGFVISASFYGISFDLTLSANPFLAGVLSGLVDIPSYLIFPLLNWLGRRRSMGLFLFITATAMFLNLIGEQPTLHMTLSLVGKLGAACAFSMVALYCGETMPTQMRALAVTLVTVATSVGGAVAPFVLTLVMQLHSAAPSVVFGAAALLAATVSLLLPETLGRRMPETPADVETTGKVSTASTAQTQEKGSCRRATNGSESREKSHCNASFNVETDSAKVSPE